MTTVRVEVLEECYAEGDCASYWSLGLSEGRWSYHCQRHEVAVPLRHGVPSECAGRARLQPGVYDLPEALAESLVGKNLAQIVQDRPTAPVNGRFNQALKRAGLPAVTAEDQDFMRQVVSAKAKARTGRPAAPIEGISADDLGEMRDLLKGMRDRK